MSTQDPTPSQFSGCLVGQCLGDALGFPVEGKGPAACRQYVEGELKAGKAGQRGRFPFAFGQYSDDSQLAREMLQVFVRQQCFNHVTYAKHMGQLFKENRIVGASGGVEGPGKRLAGGMVWNKAGNPAPDAGNGAAMRAAPIGLFYFNNHERLVQAACDAALITHKDPRCSAGSLAIAGAVALALQHDPLDSSFFIDTLVQWTAAVDASFSQALSGLREWISMDAGQAYSGIVAAGDPPQGGDGSLGIPDFVVGSVLWSLYCFLRHPDSYWDTVCTALAAGGDTDTTAAMAGAISGARVGLPKLPHKLATKVNDKGDWEFNALSTLAEDTYMIVMKL